MPSHDELIRLTATEAVALLRKGAVSPLELIDAALARIAVIEPRVNALPTLCPERARAHARRLMAEKPAPAERGWLAGLPVAIKDLVDVAGVRTTYGSPIYADHVPMVSAPLVRRIEDNGGIVLAKSNTPEFGAGGSTFNEVFGRTRNPWNTSLTCGGSSGGAAVALATGEVWLAHGSDHGGSLRGPASYCSVVGLRPAPGRVARGTARALWSPLSVQGPMARNVPDLALFLDAMCGEDLSDPLSLPPPASGFAAAVAAPTAPKRVGWSPDLGVGPVARETREICAAAARRFEELGAAVEEAAPDLSDATEIFMALRGVQFAVDRAPLLDSERARLKSDVIWNTELGLKLGGAEIAAAERKRAALYGRMLAFFADYDLLLSPCRPVPAFDVNLRHPETIDGQKPATYISGSALTYAVTLTSCPAISVPCGFTRDGRAVGLQIVGRPRGEAALLSAAALFEQLMGLDRLLPIEPRAGTVPPE
ncbi:MAG: amidase [Stellaceae bacterium]